MPFCDIPFPTSLENPQWENYSEKETEIYISMMWSGELKRAQKRWKTVKTVHSSKDLCVKQTAFVFTKKEGGS